MPDLERYRWLIVAVFTAPLLIGIGFLLRDRTSEPQPIEFTTGNSVGDIRVYVAGAVKQPGIYPLPEGTRWADAIIAAGGAQPDADLTAINLAKRVQDEDKIIVPSKGETSAVAKLININTASQKDLEALSGIGEVRAGNIVKSRATEGLFASTEDLVTRKLVPQSVYEEISTLITAGP